MQSTHRAKKRPGEAETDHAGDDEAKRPADLVAAHFRAQRGVALPSQISAAGFDPAETQQRIASGEWKFVEPGVIALGGAPEGWPRAPMIATLTAVGGASTAGTALRWHGIDGYQDCDELYFIAPNGARPRLPAGYKVWQSRRLTAADTMTRDGLRVTILPVALAHAYAVDDAELVGRGVDDALRRPGVSPAWLKQVADRWTERGIPGSGQLAVALNERCDKRLPRSWFERLAHKLLAQQGLEFEHELEVFDGRRRLAVLDLALQRYRVGVECQSWAWHASPAARRADAVRKRHLTRLGWVIIELWWSDLRNLDTIVADVRAGLDRQRRLLSSP